MVTMADELLMEVSGGERAAFPIAIPRKGIVVGRASACDLVLNDPTVSSKHCLIRWEGPGWIIRDMHSRNGVIVNGTRVPEHPLSLNDTIRVGNMKLKVVGCPQSDQPPPNLLRFLCSCGLSYVAPLSQAGREFKCMSCGRTTRIPERKPPS
jgi:hypothetical protein